MTVYNKRFLRSLPRCNRLLEIAYENYSEYILIKKTKLLN